MSFAASLRARADALWEAQHTHPFVRGIGDGTLPEDRFREYVRQDYAFLVDYGRVLSLGAARAPRLEWMARFSELAGAVLGTEMELHRRLAAAWDVTLEDVVPAPATRAYCDFLLRVGALGDFGELPAAVLPCMWGYAEIGARLARTPPPTQPERPGYAEWIATYASDEFAGLAAWARELVDGAAMETGDAGRARMRAAFETCSRLELGFWDAAWDDPAAQRPTDARRGGAGRARHRGAA